MTINAIIQARMGSTRFPGKILTCIEGKPILQHIVERLQTVSAIGDIIVATSTETPDDEVEKFCRGNAIFCFRGSQDNVLERFYQAAEGHPAHTYIRATGDNPMVDPALVDQLISFYNIHGLAYAACRQYPIGSGVEIFSSKALDEAYHNAEKPYEFEHVTPYMYQRMNLAKVDYLYSDDDLSNIRVTIDTEEDFEFARQVFGHLYSENHFFGVSEIVKLLNKYPELLAINNKVHQKLLGE